MTLVRFRFNVAFNSEEDGKMFTERWLQVGGECLQDLFKFQLRSLESYF